MKEKINKVIFNILPLVRLRVIDRDDTDKIKKEKKKFPFKLHNDVIVTVDADERRCLGFASRSKPCACRTACLSAPAFRSPDSLRSVRPQIRFLEIPLCSQSFALGAALQPAQSARLPDSVRPEFRFSFKIKKGYIWNGADIPRCFWRLVGSRTDNAFLTASMVHDFMLENKKFILEDVLKNTMTASEYRRLTSLIFRQILKDTGTGTIKANVMAWCVQIFQSTFNRKEWKNV